MRARFMLYSIEKASKINPRFVWVGKRLSGLFFSMKYDLASADFDLEPEKYLTACVFSALGYGMIAFLGFSMLLFARDGLFIQGNTLLALGFSLAAFIFFFLLHVFYPKLQAKKLASGIDNTLLFALKAMNVQVNSGLSLFEAMSNVSKSDYGLVSESFAAVVRDISTGESETKALEKMAMKTKSEHLRKTAWQLLNSIQSGASVQGALKSLVLELTRAQERAIKDYAAELNMWILMYLLLAAAIPTLGVTFLVVLSAMGGANVGQEHVILIVLGAFAVQIALIGFVKNRVPRVFLH